MSIEGTLVERARRDWEGLLEKELRTEEKRFVKELTDAATLASWA